MAGATALTWTVPDTTPDTVPALLKFKAGTAVTGLLVTGLFPAAEPPLLVTGLRPSLFRVIGLLVTGLLFLSIFGSTKGGGGPRGNFGGLGDFLSSPSTFLVDDGEVPVEAPPLGPIDSVTETASGTGVGEGLTPGHTSGVTGEVTLSFFWTGATTPGVLSFTFCSLSVSFSSPSFPFPFSSFPPFPYLFSNLV